MSVPEAADPAATTILIVAGEASGDLHGAKLMEALRRRDPSLRFAGMGGPLMRAQGFEALHDSAELSVMGLVEVLPKLGKVLSILASLRRWAEARRPRAAILIDSPDFNLRLARDLQLLGVPVAFFIAPMAWAWRESRVRQLRHLDRLLCIFPFEEAWFGKRRVPASYVGNPLLDDPLLAAPPEMAAARASLSLPAEGGLLALLPGSRPGEVGRLLPVLVEAADRLAAEAPGLLCAIPVAPGLPRDEVEAACAGRPHLRVVEGRAAELLVAADAAAVCSGTATLQAALARCPTVVVYRTHPLNFALIKRVVRLSHASIANLLTETPVFPELLQEACSAEAVAAALRPLLRGGPAREEMLGRLEALRRRMGGPGASERAAEEVLAMIRGEPARRLAS